MSLLAADINDAGVTVLSNDGVLYREPGFALLDDAQLVTGVAAYKWARVKPRHIHDKFWSSLSVDALPDRRFRHLSSADLVSRQVEDLWRAVSDKGDRLVVAVPAYMSADKLGLFLGICNELGVPVAALVDAAVASTRREYVNARLVHVDISLHSTMLTRMAQPGRAQAEKSMLIEDSGLVALHNAWIRSLAEAFVQQSRFDPLHTAETEQLMLDRMPEWLLAASAGGAIDIELEHGGLRHAAQIDALALIAEAAPVYQRIISQLRALVRADETPALQLSDRAAALPGLADMLKARVGGEVYVLEAAATARGLLGRCRDMAPNSQQVSLLRQLPWDQAATEVTIASEADRGGQPTHLLFENTAYELTSQALNLGSQAVAGERWVDLASNIPGVSRRHCSLQIENGQCVVRDFSRYGTFLNGHRLDGSAVLQIGDVLRIGTPGYELRLITTDASDGA